MMFFNALIQRRLSALLRPWLADEPELEVKLGFLRSHGIATNLRFNASALNQLLDDPSRVCFREVVVEQFGFHVSNWSAPAFNFRIQGLRVSLALGENEGSAEIMPKPRDKSIDQKRKLLAELDPQGSSLHAAMERITEIREFKWTDSLFDCIFQHCQFQVRDVEVTLLHSHSNGFVSFSFLMKELGVGCESVRCCFLSGAISSFLLPSRESYIDIDIDNFEITLNTEHHVSNIVPSTNLHASIKSKNHSFIEFDFSVEALKLSLSPFHVSAILLLFVLSSKEAKSIRSGRQLWKIAADKIKSLTSMRKFLLHKVVCIICIWIQYIHTYEKMLLLVGYPSEDSIRQSVGFMVGGKTYSIAFKQHWKKICQMEDDLPSEAIALARKIIRNRAASGSQKTREFCHESKVKALFMKIFTPLIFFGKYICYVFCFIKSFQYSAGKCSNSNEDLGHVPNGSFLCRHIVLDVGEFSILISPEDEVHPSVSGKMLSDIGLAYHELLSFSVFIDVLHLRYSENITQQCLAFGCQSFRVVPLSLIEGNYRKSVKYLNGAQKKKSQSLSPVLWGEPAEIVHSVENTAYHANGTGIPGLSFKDYIIGEMLLKWRKCCSKVGANEIQDFVNPFALCEINNLLIDQTMQNSTLGSLRCGMVVGRLNLIIENASVVSVAVISTQIKNALSWTRSNVETSTVLHATSPSSGDLPSIDWRNNYILLSSQMAVAEHASILQKHIHMRIRVAGPHIQISLINMEHHDQLTGLLHATRNGMAHLRIEAANMELSVSPNLESDFSFSSKSMSVADAKAKSIRLMELRQSGIPKLNDETMSSQTCISIDTQLKFDGVKVYLDITNNPRSQVIVLAPVTFRLISSRKDLHSLGSTVIVWFISLIWAANGLAVVLFLDEMNALVKAAYDLSRAMLHVLNLPSLATSLIHHKISFQEMSSNPGNHGVMMTRSAAFFRGLIIIENICELKSVEIILHYSRKVCNTDSDGMNAHIDTNQKLDCEAWLDCGIHMSIEQFDLLFSFEPEKVNICIKLSGFQSDILGQIKDIAEVSDQFELNNLFQSLHCLYGVSCSYGKFEMCWKAIPLPSLINSADVYTSSSVTLLLSGDSPLMVKADDHSFDCLHMSIVLDEVYLVGCPVKKLLIQSHKPNKLEGSLCVGGELRNISCEIQGGYIASEATAVVMFVQCFALYHFRFRELWPAATLVGEKHAENVEVIKSLPSQELWHQQLINWNQFKALSINISQLSLGLMGKDESGGLQELLLETSCEFNLKAPTIYSFSISKLSIISCSFDMTTEQRIRGTNILSPFVMSNERDSSSVISSKYEHNIHSFDDASSSSSHVLQKEIIADDSEKSHTNNAGSQNLLASPQNYVLRDLSASLVVEQLVLRKRNGSQQLNYFWVGRGSLLGFDMTISLPEIQMILLAGEQISGLYSNDTNRSVKQRSLASGQEFAESMDHDIPDGTIVAIEDVSQHMFIAVNRAESSYTLVGEIHYSLAGERALFRVKYHESRRWMSQTSYFSLISLYANDEYGEPLRLSCRMRSDYVDISISDRGACTLWYAIPCELKAFEGAADCEMFPSTKRMFQLVNKKNGRAAAFVDGVLEFVSKPGNPFKWKVLDNHFPTVNNHSPSILREESQTGNQYELQVKDRADHGKNENTSGITITMDNISWTIVHELSHTKEKFPLLQGSISSTETMVQISNNKIRVMSRLQALLYYFDAKKNLWRKLMHPLEVFIFYRYRLLSKDLEHVTHRVPGHLYARTGELNLSMCEAALDIILFVIGQLNLAGPYAVKSSNILANCCKIENKSSLTLVCNFYDNQDVSVSGRQSSVILLRHLASTNQSPDAYVFSIQLTETRVLSTSLIRLSLLEAQAFSCRTRIESLKDSKTFPGPFLVVEISPNTEDGFLVVVSPLLQVRNETDFPLELRFQRGQQKDTEYAFAVLDVGDTLDDSMATFGAISLSGEQRKALMSLSVGNFLLSFRPSNIDGITNSKISTVHWSSDLKGRKPVHLSGIFDKLSYQVRKAFSVKSLKYSFSTVYCDIEFEDGRAAKIHFLIHSIGKDVPLTHPDTFGYVHADKNSSISLQEQKEIFLIPTVCVSNLLQTEIHVALSETGLHSTLSSDSIWNTATIASGSCVNLYADPAFKYFNVTLTAYTSSCKPIASADWVKKLQKQKSNISHLDIELEFCNGKYFALLRLSRGHRGKLEAAIFTSYTLENDMVFPFICLPANQKPMPRDVVQKLGSEVPPELGSYLPPKSTRSWFMKCHKVRLTLADESTSDALLDLDALSGLTEVDFELEERSGFKLIKKMGVSLRPYILKELPSQMVSINPRYVVVNESNEVIYVRQCYLEENGMETIITINSKQRVALTPRRGIPKKRETTVFETFLKKHQKTQDDLSFIQFRLNDYGLRWSGPVCIASLGRFFLKFKRSLEFQANQSDHSTCHEANMYEFAVVNVVEEGSSLVLHFYQPLNVDLPYRIENCLHDTAITFYQKGLILPEVLGSGSSTKYAWDDLTLPHKLIIQIGDVHLLREISLDKVREWKKIYGTKQQRQLGLHLPIEKQPENPKSDFRQSSDTEMVNLGYEVYTDGLTRVLRISEFADRRRGDTLFHSRTKMQLIVSSLALKLLECARQEISEVDNDEPSIYSPVVVVRLEGICLNSVFTDRHKFNQLMVQTLSVDQKWHGAPFAAMLRRYQLEDCNKNDSVLLVELALVSSNSKVKQVKYLSIVLQPLDFKLDEETLMKLAPLWRSSLSYSNTPSQQYYFEHFEIHPIKIVASFLPGEAYASYSSTQETLRTLLHSVIKMPVINNMNVELNGVLVTHVLLTLRELSIKCAQHYSWYTMRAIYIAKGSPLLPPAFASIFDDFASSSLDVFFDPSSGFIKFPGLTMGTFKLIKKCIDGKGFSGTKRYLGDLGKTFKSAGSNILFAAVTEVSDSVLKGAEASGFNGMVIGFHQGILKLAMEPSVLSTAFMEGGPDRKIRLDRSPGVDELYIEGYLQAMLDTVYKQAYLSVRVLETQVILKNLPPNSSLIDEIVERVKGFLVSKGLLKGGSSKVSHPLRHIRGEREWRFGPTVLTLCEHLFVSFAIRMLRRQANKVMANVKWKGKESEKKAAIVSDSGKGRNFIWRWGIGSFVISGIVAYIDGRLCRRIPNPIARRIVSGFLLSFLDKNSEKQ
ncbi:hypothetical protein DM860_008479 [Cuscuta australis]|uniref:Vacuolar protein sorting-associated protein 13 VPS13 adaptor binding domain-containing protein n=1 Tax=Cuscuta australis TaxID=267555 RepID=A0A328D900_9ASTE|nr:hypothetical protein DM860_008479 [Cuscuta australis]